MRKLAMFCLSFALSAVIGVYSGAGVWLAIAGAAAILIGIAVRALCRSDWGRAALLLCLGFGCGAVYCFGYGRLVLQPKKQSAGTAVTLTAEICRMPEPASDGCRALATAELNGKRCKLLLYLNDAPALRLGDRVTGMFFLQDSMQDRAQAPVYYYQVQDIDLTGTQQDAVIVRRPASLPLRLYPMAAAEKLKQTITRCFSPDTAGFLQALLTGDRSGLSYAENNALRRSGISHTVAISGMHVSILLGMVALLCGKRRRRTALLGYPVILLFMAMVGFTPSVVRAGIMQMILLAAPLLRRENDGATSLGFSLLLILLANPWAAAGMSLQLSYGAVAGIFLFTERVNKALLSPEWVTETSKRSRLFKGLYSGAAALISTTLGAMIFTTPIVALYTSSVPVLSLLTNLLVLPVISVCFTAGLLVCMIGLFWAAAGKVLAFPVGLLIKYVLCVANGVSAIPFAALDVTKPYFLFWLCFAYLLLGVFLLLRGKKRPLVFVCCLLLSLMSSVLLSALDAGRSECSVTALDVGQGQCVVTRCGDFTAMIDCGGSRAEEAGEAAARYLEQSGSMQLDVLVLTHYDTDHIGGIEQLFSRVTVQRLYLPQMEDDAGNREWVIQLAAEYDVPVRYITADTSVSFSDGSLTVFAPVADDNDNDGLCVLFSVHEFDALVTGDLDISGEYRLLSTRQLPDLEVLVAGHHGSKYSTSDTLLALTTPEAVLICVGPNAYGHPTEQTLARIRAAGAKIYRTDVCGDITIRR